MSFANFLEAELLDHLFDIGAYSAPTIYAGLSTADPGDDAAGLSEPGSNYARILVSGWSRSGSEVDNDAAITFAEASGSWGTITYGCLFDAVSGGNLLLSFVLDTPRAITSGVTPRFSAGEFNIALE